ncbi:MAG: hypothetical protein LBJ12_07625 [Oscillospiraceae bacterium]|nr:hypothetical protein [Oscillospiraceae bacterium]
MKYVNYIRSKWLAMVLAATILAISASVAVVIAAPNPAITVGDANASEGENVEVTVMVANNPGVISLFTDINYDTTRLRLTKVANGAIFNTKLMSAGNKLGAVPYKINYLDSSAAKNTAANGVLYTLEFEVRAGAPLGNAAVSVSYDWENTYNIDLENVPFAVTNGKVIVQSSTTAPTTTIADTTTTPTTTAELTTEPPTTPVLMTEAPTTPVLTTEPPTTLLPSAEPPTTLAPTTELPTTLESTTEPTTTSAAETESLTTFVSTTALSTIHFTNIEKPTTASATINGSSAGITAVVTLPKTEAAPETTVLKTIESSGNLHETTTARSDLSEQQSTRFKDGDMLGENGNNQPGTGDSAHLVFWSTLFVLCGALMALASHARKKTKN